MQVTDAGEGREERRGPACVPRSMALKGDGLGLTSHQVFERQDIAQIANGAGTLLADGVSTVR